jgi:predicted aldo/keto reductase-like oxidoreductase
MEHFDFYLLHALNESHWPRLRDLGVLDWAEKKMAEGSIGHLGFSFHDKYELFQRIIDDYDGWTFCQIQYNYMDEEYQAGTKGLEYAAKKGLAVVVMEPIRGGALARNVPPVVQELWDSAPVRRTPAAWALEWVWNHPQVSVVLSGMSTMEQVQENLVTADQSAPPTLTDEEIQIVARVRDTYHDLCPIPCTACGYCLPCPNNINIPRIFEIYNDRVMYNDDQRAQMLYSWLSEDERANMCVACGECLEECPQEIEIPDWLEKAHQILCGEEETST